MNDFSKETRHFLLPGLAGALEVITTWPKHALRKAVGIICHPHPLYAGTMYNKVVTTLAKAFDHLGLPTIRFNFRGVGDSEGEYGHTLGETDDLKSIYYWSKQVLPEYEVWLGGFSFGAYIAAKLANQKSIAQLVTVAPAVNHFDFFELTDIRCPWLAIHGDQDEIVPPKAVINFAEHPPTPIKLIVLPGAGHFFHGHLLELRDILQKELK